MDRIIEFFKDMNLYDKNYFDYLQKNTKILDGPYEEIITFIGCYKLKDDECRLVLPKIKTIYDELIYVHEYTHALFLDDKTEIFPNVMEAIYVNKYIKNRKLKKEILRKTEEQLEGSNHKSHRIGKIIKILSIEH